MSYKGEDLDLRSPRVYRGEVEQASRDLLSGGVGGANGPIWVDETLMSCCNHAFDVAYAHRAAEVHIEHLLYALTRVDSAAEILEASGVRDAGLRRESAMIIASTIPVGLTNGKSSPRASAALQDALRLASERGAKSNRAGSVHDLLDVFLDQRPELDGLDLLRRHLSTQARTRPSQGLRTNSGAAGEGGSLHSLSTTDQLQNSRIEALERMVQSLGGGAGQGNIHEARHMSTMGREPFGYGEQRGSIGGQDMYLRDASGHLERSLITRLDETLQHLALLSERLSVLESVVSEGRGSSGADVAGLNERLGRFEKILASNSGGVADFSPIEKRLNDIELAILSRDETSQGVGSLADRLDRLEAKIDQQAVLSQEMLSDDGAALERSGVALSAELKAVTGAVASQAATAERLNANLRERIDKIEEQLTVNALEESESYTALANDMGELNTAVAQVNETQHSLAELLEKSRLESSGDLSVVANRLAALEESAADPREEIARLSKKMDRMYRVNVERYHRRNRIWYWLFGTDDWIGASWPSQTAQVERDLANLQRRRGTGSDTRV